MCSIRFFATTGDAVARLDIEDQGTVDTRPFLEGSGAQCVAVDPHDSGRVYAGTFDDGVYRSLDGGENWEPVSGNLPHRRVLSIAVSPVDCAGGKSVVYAGTEPSMLFRTEDDGETWQGFPALSELPSRPAWSFPPRPWTHHVRWIATHPLDPMTLYVGIELGGVMCTRDGGVTWEDRKPGSQHDAHALSTHPAAPDRVYEAAGGGVARSDDAGETWRPADEGMDRHYTWGLAVDAADPDLWYVSATHGAGHAHRSNGNAEAMLFRRRGESPWESLGGHGAGIERPLSYMPYALVAPRGRPNVLLAGMQNGTLYRTDDAGETWRRLETGLPSLLALSESSLP